MAAIKNKPCKHCGSELHLSLKCFNKPIKPPKTALKDKKAKTPKKKAQTRSQVIKKLDIVFSQYIRLDKTDVDGYGECVTCGNRLFWKELQNGHYISRGKYPTRWDEDNCHLQDYRCNVVLNGNYIEYTLYMLDSYGREFVDQLKSKSINGEKISTPQLKEMIDHYTQEVKRLKSEKGLD